jgi:hypothetical protein
MPAIPCLSARAEAESRLRQNFEHIGRGSSIDIDTEII